METGIRRLLLYQSLLVAAISVASLGLFDMLMAGSVLFGGGIAMVNALIAARCARRDARRPERTPQQSLAAIYICVVQRFVIAAGLFAVALGALTLNALALLAGFIAGQLVMVVIGTQQLTKK